MNDEGNPPAETEDDEEPSLSVATYTDRREERINYYYFVRRVTKPPAIYDFMLRECRDCLGPDVGSSHADPLGDGHVFVPLISKNRVSGLRTVQTVVMRLRAEAEPEEILKLRRPIETAKVLRTYDYLLQKQIDVIEDNSSVTVQKLSPSGIVVSVIEPRCSKADKGKAVKAAMILAEKIGRLTGAELIASEPAPVPGVGADGEPARGFTFNFPNVASSGGTGDIDAMIALNIEAGKVN